MKLNGIEIDTSHEGCQFTTSKKSRIKLNTNRPRKQNSFNGRPQSHVKKQISNNPKTNMQVEEVSKIFKNILKGIAYLFIGLIILTFVLPILIDLLFYF